jgi:hypothetical protein
VEAAKVLYQDYLTYNKMRTGSKGSAVLHPFESNQRLPSREKYKESFGLGKEKPSDYNSSRSCSKC